LHEKYQRVLAMAGRLPPLPTAVVHPCDAVSLSGAMEAKAIGLIDPILVAPEQRLRVLAAQNGIDLTGVRVLGSAHSHESAALAVGLVRHGQVEALMKGSLHTDELMAEVVARETGIRTDRRISHCFIMDVPGYAAPLIITDAAVNIAPSLEEKADIVRNAIDVAHAIGLDRPLVAILSATETVTPKVPSTIDAAALCKMADRGQITGGVLDGPLALDNAINPQAAEIKHIVSPVAGHACILVVPDLEAGNMLAKSLSFLAGAESAGIVLGARVPIILTSRADNVVTRLASCAVAVLVADSARRKLAAAMKG
jgi:phosphate acetyltransferase